MTGVNKRLLIIDNIKILIDSKHFFSLLMFKSIQMQCRNSLHDHERKLSCHSE